MLGQQRQYLRGGIRIGTVVKGQGHALPVAGSVADDGQKETETRKERR